MEAIELANQYAEKNWPVFPLHTIHGGKCTCNRCCRAPAKHPKLKGGFKSASTNNDNIKRWFSEPANIGIATGQPSGLVVIDVDDKNGGYDSLAKLEQKFGILSEFTLTAQTGGGGLHIYFNHTGEKVRSRVNALGSGIDIRADGGYVVSAPSKHVSGKDYYWRDGLHSPAELPEDLVEVMMKNPAKNGHSSAGIIIEGARNTALFNIAARLRAKGQDQTQIEHEIIQVNSSRCRPPLSNSEVIEIAISACRYAKGSELKPLRDYWLDMVYSKYSGLKGNVRNVLTALYFYMDQDGGNCHPSHELLAERAGCNRQAVSKNLKIAESEGWIKSFRVANQFSPGFHYGYIAVIPSLTITNIYG